MDACSGAVIGTDRRCSLGGENRPCSRNDAAAPTPESAGAHGPGVLLTGGITLWNRSKLWSRSIPCLSIRFMIGVIKATPLEGHVLRLEFSDGVVGDVDCEFLLAGGLGADLRDPAYFSQISVDPELRTVVWPNGLDPAPELIRSRIRSEAGVSSASSSPSMRLA